MAIHRIAPTLVFFTTACIGCASTGGTPTTSYVASYSGVGRITWNIPKDLDYIPGVPHWTAGPRILCKESAREDCEVMVFPRDLAVSGEARAAEFFANFKSEARDSVE